MEVGLMERMYHSRFGRLMSNAANFLARLQRPFMVYGYHDYPSGKFRKYTRISSSATIMNKKALSMADHVWVWHHSILDATEGLEIQEGCQIGAWVGIFTHGSERAIRFLGDQFVHFPNQKRIGYTRGRVTIGAYTFVGAGSVILPGVNIGKGCLVGTGTLVTKDVADYSIVVGSPGQVKGSTIELDKKYYPELDFSSTYYDSQALAKIRESADSE